MPRMKCVLPLFLVAAVAHAQQPDPRKVAAAEQIFAAANPGATLKPVFAQVGAAMRQQMEPMLDKQLPKTADREAVRKDISDFQDRVLKRMTEELRVEKMKPAIVQMYVDEFTLEQLQAIADFYKSPAGQALSSKMPVIAAKGMQAGQQLIQGFLPELQQMTLEWTTQMKQKYGGNKPPE